MDWKGLPVVTVHQAVSRERLCLFFIQIRWSPGGGGPPSDTNWCENPMLMTITNKEMGREDRCAATIGLRMNVKLLKEN